VGRSAVACHGDGRTTQVRGELKDGPVSGNRNLDRKSGSPQSQLKIGLVGGDQYGDCAAVIE